MVDAALAFLFTVAACSAVAVVVDFVSGLFDRLVDVSAAVAGLESGETLILANSHRAGRWL